MKSYRLASLIVLLFSMTCFSQEYLEVEGAIRISNTNNLLPEPGTMRWSGSDFEGWNGIFWVSLTGNLQLGSVVDLDGNTYGTIAIGSQEWMIENLRVNQYNDGTTIDQITSDALWSTSSSGAWCWYNNDNTYESPYGKLYNGFAVNSSNLCPLDWHVPTDAEWTILIDFLDPAVVDPSFLGIQSSVSGGKMKEVGLTHWNTPNSEATNEVGWTGLPGGYRGSNGLFYSTNNVGVWWGYWALGGNAWFRSIDNNSGDIIRNWNNGGRRGHSVRCIKD